MRIFWNILNALSFFEAIFFPLVKEICFRGSQVDDFRASVPVLLLNGALFAVIGVRDARPSADDTPSLVAAVVALVAYPDQRAGSNVRVTDDTATVTLFTQASNGHAGLLPAKDQIWMMLGHP